MQANATLKLYQDDSFLTTCSTTVVALDPQGAPKVVLAQTVFFAEGGGQPADRGSLVFDTKTGPQTAQVQSVHEKDGLLWHTLDALPQGVCVGDGVQGSLDWAHRLDSMQQHSGEHILSGVLYQLYGAQNVGFHIGHDMVRMDTSCPLTAQQLQKAENMANEIIWQNKPIETLLPSAEALQAMTYRSKKELMGEVRIVRIAGADTCACCGTHLRHTGQVGQIKILTQEHYKGGERLSVVCGKRALSAAQGMRMREGEIGALLSAKAEQTAQAVRRVYDEMTALKFAKQGIELQLFDALAAQAKAAQTPPYTSPTADTSGAACPAIFTVNGLAPDGLHKLAATRCAQTNALCAALCEQSGKAEGSISTGYCLALAEGDVRPLCKALNAQFAGRGGGKPNICQGSAAASAAEIAAFLQAAVQEMR